MSKIIVALLGGSVLASCADSGDVSPASGEAPRTESDTASFQQRFAAPIEEAHADSIWTNSGVLQTGLNVTFGGQTRFDGQMLMETSMGRTRLDFGGDTVAVFDGERVWVAPDTAVAPRAHFNLLTWAYFAAAPYKLRDPGTRLADRDSMMLNGQRMPVARLTFEAGTGPSPDDWYMLYRDPQTGRLAAMAYIVTYGKQSAEEATPHAIVYGGYQRVDGVPIPTTWTFYNWSGQRGPPGDPIGRVTLRNPRFAQPADSAFAPPTGAQQASLPAGA
jgi:hypothetical protein